MRALVYQDRQLQLIDCPKPEPGEDEVLIKVLMAGICTTDLEIIQGYLNYTGIIGHEFVGEVVLDPKDEYTGKRVVGSINIPCNTCDYCQRGMEKHCRNLKQLGIRGKDGAFAEYMALPRQNIHSVPESISNLEAVLVEPMAAGVEIAEQLHIRPEDEVVILGDGKLGLVTAMALWSMGANVKLVGKHENKLIIAQQLGIPTCYPDEVDGEFKVVVECTGRPSGMSMAQSIVEPQGTIVVKTTIKEMPAFDLSEIAINEINILGSRCGPFEPTLRLIERNELPLEELVERVFSLEEWKEAISTARKKGVLKVVFRME
ncbi:MAG: alcohol dehydrogenase catalytic domain-containing protein [Halanaerobium sp.]|nr:alcohol dehydrogenase catalytic domain-containing protein [Halanaerobium sp.]